MPRKKPKNLYPIKNLEDANNAMAQIAAIKRELTGIENKMNEDIDRIKAEADIAAAPLNVRLSSIENGLLAFAEFSKEDLFSEKRSKELDFGSIGYRRSRELKPKPKTTWKMVLGRIKELKFPAIRTKESVDKDELSKWPDERLDLVGARRVKKDTFWYEIDEKKIADKAA